MPELLIQLTKRRDGDATLRCIRPDGSATWQRHRGRQAGFFPLHDLTHYAIETELGFRRGFYGLIAEGWDIEDTGVSPTRGPLPSEAIIVEHIVGSLDVQRADGSTWTTDEFNEQVVGFAATRNLSIPRAFTEDELARLRTRLRELLDRWRALPAGETLELPFDRGPAFTPLTARAGVPRSQSQGRPQMWATRRDAPTRSAGRPSRGLLPLHRRLATKDARPASNTHMTQALRGVAV